MRWNKWDSTRWLIVVWSMALLTAEVLGMLAGLVQPGAEAGLLAGVAGAYVAGKSYEKKYTYKGEPCGE